MTPKESYRVARRSSRYDADKEAVGLKRRWPNLLLRWMRIPGLDKQMSARSWNRPDFEDPPRHYTRLRKADWAPGSNARIQYIGKPTSTWQTSKFLSTDHPLRLSMSEMAERQLDLMRQVNTLRPQEYLPANHPARLTVQRAARVKLGIEPAFKARRHADVVLPPPVEYVKPQPLHKSKLVDKADPYYTPPQLWMPEHMEEAAVSFGQDDYEMSDDSSTPALELVDDSDWWETSKHTDRDEQYKPVRSEALSDPLVQMLQAEGSYDEASDLCRLHRAGFAHNSMNFYMQQRPDLYPQTLPGTVWVSQANGSTAEVKPYIRNPRKVA